MEDRISQCHDFTSSSLVGRLFPHITQLWQVILTLPASTSSCERGFSTQNLTKSYRRCALNITTLDTLMRIAMAKIPMESLDFEDIWERWMSVKDRRFQE